MEQQYTRPSSGKIRKKDDSIFYLSDSIDERSSAIAVMQLPHKTIHDEKHYFVSDHLELQSGDVARFIVDTSETNSHMLFGIATEGQTEIELYEGVEYTEGTEITTYNSDRDSTKTSGLKVFQDPTIDSGEVQENIIAESKWGTAVTPQRDIRGGSLRRSNEIILKKGTAYCFKIESGTSENIINYNLDWYEE